LKAKAKSRRRKALARPKDKEKTPSEISEEKCIIAVRLRGQANVPNDVKTTLHMLHMPRKFNAVLVYGKPDTLGMLRKIKDYVTWGETERKTLSMLLEKRCKPRGAKELTAKHLKEKLQIPSIEKLAEAIERKEIPLSKLHEAGISLAFRLHPPRGGFKRSTKRSFGDEGELGYRGNEISPLLSRMI
jgi:large subunit ribosomal protein L30